MIVSESHIGILDVKVSHVICTVNTEGHMGRGIALYLKKCIPGLYDAYRVQCKQKQLLVNTLWVYENSEPKILCFPTKDKTWEDSRLEWIEANLHTLRDTYRERGITSVAMPPLGCGNGNLEWASVRALIYAILGDCDLQVHLCLGRKLPVPAEDNQSHINIWTKSASWLGRQLSNLSKLGFLHEDHGWFECLEGYWYWLATGCKHDQFKQMSGFEAKGVGSKMERIEMPDFQARFKEGMRLRLEQHPQLRHALLESTLPFEHYYVYGNDVVRDLKQRHQWQLDFYDDYRKTAQLDHNVMNILIAGGRGFNNYVVFKHVVTEQLAHFETPFDRDYDINIVTGLAHSGPDNMAIQYARETGCQLTGWPALWDKYQKRAGMIRNHHMSKQDLHYAIIFWDGESHGTKNMIELLVKNDIAHFVYIYPKE